MVIGLFAVLSFPEQSSSDIPVCCILVTIHKFPQGTYLEGGLLGHTVSSLLFDITPYCESSSFPYPCQHLVLSLTLLF